MVLARAAAVIVSLAQTCIWWRPYHTTLGVIQTISREHGVLCSEQVCVHSYLFFCEPETITCLHARPFCVWLYCLYHCYLEVDRVEVVQHTWLPESVPCSPSPDMTSWSLIKSIKAIQPSRGALTGAEETRRRAPLLRTYFTYLEPMGIGQEYIELFGVILF